MSRTIRWPALWRQIDPLFSRCVEHFLDRTTLPTARFSTLQAVVLYKLLETRGNWISFDTLEHEIRRAKPRLSQEVTRVQVQRTLTILGRKLRDYALRPDAVAELKGCVIERERSRGVRLPMRTADTIRRFADTTQDQGANPVLLRLDVIEARLELLTLQMQQLLRALAGSAVNSETE